MPGALGAGADQLATGSRSGGGKVAYLAFGKPRQPRVMVVAAALAGEHDGDARAGEHSSEHELNASAT